MAFNEYTLDHTFMSMSQAEGGLHSKMFLRSSSSAWTATILVAVLRDNLHLLCVYDLFSLHLNNWVSFLTKNLWLILYQIQFKTTIHRDRSITFTLVSQYIRSFKRQQKSPDGQEKHHTNEQ